jgi:hypothetical protein
MHGEDGRFFVSKNFPLDSGAFSHHTFFPGHFPDRPPVGGWGLFFGSETSPGHNMALPRLVIGI